MLFTGIICLSIFSGLILIYLIERKPKAVSKTISREKTYFIDHFEIDYKAFALERAFEYEVYVVEFIPCPKFSEWNPLWDPYIHFYLYNRFHNHFTEHEVKFISDRPLRGWRTYPGVFRLKKLEEFICEEIKDRFHDRKKITPIDIKQWLTHKEKSKRDLAKKIL